MGVGLAKTIRDKWPVVYEKYRNAFTDGKLALGRIQIIDIKPGLKVANLMGQDAYGRGGIFTDYNAVRICLKKLQTFRSINCPELSVFIPFKMGCSLAGGNWATVLDIIHSEMPDAFVCRKPMAAFTGGF